MPITIEEVLQAHVRLLQEAQKTIHDRDLKIAELEKQLKGNDSKEPQLKVQK